MVVTKPILASRRWAKICVLLAIALLPQTLIAAVLPEDRTDVLYHRYQGGGITIDGPSVLVRKQFKDKVSIWGNIYTDNISGASIDLLARGSSYYEEHRTEKSVGMDYLYNRTVVSLSHTNSSERDYEASSYGFSLSQDFFGDMSTLTMNFSQGNDDVRKNIYAGGEIVNTVPAARGREGITAENELDKSKARHRRYGIGLSQVLTTKWIVALNAENVVDEGFLNNPYRTVRHFTSSGDDNNTNFENYPTTRNSDAFAIRSMYYLPYRAAVRLEYRTYLDSWGIEGSNYEIRYIQPFGDNWIIEGKFREYEQTQADFYADIFTDFALEIPTFYARDKEMSTYGNQTFELGISYELNDTYLSFIDKSSINFYWNHIIFDYQNFRENTPENKFAFGAGNEPLYGFSANVFRIFLSINY